MEIGISGNLYPVSITEWIVLLRAQKARMLLGVWIANVHTGFLMETRTLSETGLLATLRQKTWLHFAHDLRLLMGD